MSDRSRVHRPRVAVWAYACNPERGSDPGATWGYVRALAEYADLFVLHSCDDSEHLRAWKRRHPDAPIEFVEVPEPGWAATISRAYGLHRQLQFVTYLAWLRDALAVTRRLQRTVALDAVSHASYGNYWLPSPVWKLGLPSLWGPVGGGVRTPVRLWPSLGVAGVVAELERSLGLSLAAALPGTRRTQRRVTVPIVETEETRLRLVRSRRDEAVIVNRAVIIDPTTAGVNGHGSATPSDLPSSRSGRAEFLFTSALWGKKGPRLAIAALRYADPAVHLTFVNDGYDHPRLDRLARRYGVAERVHFLGRVPRDELFARMRDATGLVFAGLREEGGVALAEAMYQGLPVIVLDHGGAGLMARQALDPDRVRLVAAGGPHETARRLGAAMTALHVEAPEERTPSLNPQPHLQAIEAALAAALASARASHALRVEGRT